jgi:Cof subfamily protein (haloacid dehalogenase superfamily)
VPKHLLAVDLDFTLLDADREIAEENRAAVRRATEHDIAVVLASGRGLAAMRRFADSLDLTGPMVTCNGAFVVTPSGRIIKEHVLPRERLRKVIEFARAGGFHLNLYCREEVLMAENSPWADVYVTRAKQHRPRAIGWEALADINPNKAIILTEPETVLAIEASARALFEEPGAVTLSEPEYLEFLCPEANKATGLAAVAEVLEVPLENTAAIGDYYNDIPMLRWAAHSAAVENAPEEVLSEADIVVARHDRHGVSAYIDLLIANLGQWNARSIVYNRGRAL